MRAITVMGVSGSGKTSVGTAICARTGARLIEGDVFHPAENIRKMSVGIALTDDDRHGWLESLAAELSRAIADGEYAVLTCSALKRRYRDVLRAAVPALGFVFLDLTPEEAAERVAHRAGHFMPASLIHSQFRDLQPPRGEPQVLTIRATHSVDEIAKQAVEWWIPRGVTTV